MFIARQEHARSRSGFPPTALAALSFCLYSLIFLIRTGPITVNVYERTAHSKADELGVQPHPPLDA